MKTFVVTAGLLVLISTSALGQTYDLKLHLGTGETVTIASTDVRKVTFTNLTLGVTLAPAAATARRIQFVRCYPNPFSASTTIAYALSAAADVRVRVYDLKGALVRELVNGNVAGGRYAVAWDGTDRNHAPVASGLYFYRVECGAQSLSGRFVRVE